MTTIPVAEVRGKFAALLGRVEAGEVVVISRHGRPVARLIGESMGFGEAAAAAWLERLRLWHGLEARPPQPARPSLARLAYDAWLAPYARPHRWGSRGFLLDASVITALLLPGPRSAAALAWLEQVGAAALAVSAASLLELEGNLARARAAAEPPARPFSKRTARHPAGRSARRRLPQSWLDAPVPAWPAQQELLADFLAERCPVSYPEPADYRAATTLYRWRPGMAPAQLLLELQLAERTCLKPVSLKPLLGALARRLTSGASVVTLAAPAREVSTREVSTHSG